MPDASSVELTHTPVVVIGAGPAGLAVSRELKRRAIDHLVLEAETVGSSWARYYRGLVLHTGRHLSHLPGRRLPADMPLFPPRDRFLRYLTDYAAEFGLPIRERTRVHSAKRKGDGWRLETSGGAFAARAIIAATGIASNPHRPVLRGEMEFGGRILHSAEYSQPEPLVGQRVLVIGVGNSGGEIAAELGAAGVDTAISVRSGAHLMPLRILGVPAQYWAAGLALLPSAVANGLAAGMGALRRSITGASPIPLPDRPVLARPPLIGDSLPSALRSGRVKLRGSVDRLLPGAIRFEDGLEEPFDTVLLATGYRAAVGFLGDLVRLDENGFPLREGVRSLDHPDLFLVGQRYGPAGALMAIRQDAPRVAASVAELLASASARQAGETISQ